MKPLNSPLYDSTLFPQQSVHKIKKLKGGCFGFSLQKKCCPQKPDKRVRVKPTHAAKPAHEQFLFMTLYGPFEGIPMVRDRGGAEWQELKNLITFCFFWT